MSFNMGKASKQRLCPAVGRKISAGECGECRGSRYTCPEDCGHNPFEPANYLQLLEIEDGLDAKTVGRMFEDAPDRPALEGMFRRAAEAKSPQALHVLTSWRLFNEQGADGMTCAQRWERAGFPGLKNDERVLFRAKMQMRVALLEIRCVIDEQHIEATDLFAPDRPTLSIVDRSLARQAVRFASFLTWAFPLPHFCRMAGSALVIPDWAPFEPLEIVTELVRHLGGPAGVEPMRRWLAEHFLRFGEALNATAWERRRLMFAAIDAKWGSAVYELRAPFSECRDVVDKTDRVEEDNLDEKERREGFAEARTWLDDAASPAVVVPEEAAPILGRVLLGQTFWRIEAMGAERLARLRGRLETVLGSRVRFTGERLDDVGARMANDEPRGDPALVPPRLLENAPRIEMVSSRLAMPAGGSREEIEAKVEEDQRRAFLDEAVPALDGRTPREAARDPVLRPKLVRLMKTHVRGHDENDLRSGRSTDINWLLRELGLDELDVPAPPLRPPPAAEDDEDRERWDEDEDEPDDGRTAPDPLPEEPFDFDEAAERLKAALDEFDTAQEALDELQLSGSTLMTDVSELTGDLLSEHEFSYLVVFLIHAWFALIQPGFRAPQLRLPVMRDALEREIDLLYKNGIPDRMDVLSAIVSDSRQPALLQLLLGHLFEGVKNAPKKIRPSIESQPAMIAVLKVVTNELDHALRERD